MEVVWGQEWQFHPKTNRKDGDSSVVLRNIVCGFDNRGKRYKSSREVKEALKEQNYLGPQSETEAETNTGSQ